MTEAPKRYETEERELVKLLDLAAGEEGDTDAALSWLDRTLYMHREQAYAEGLLDGKHAYRWAAWWDRNWFAAVLTALLVAGSVAIGLKNGWS